MNHPVDNRVMKGTTMEPNSTMTVDRAVMEVNWLLDDGSLTRTERALAMALIPRLEHRTHVDRVTAIMVDRLRRMTTSRRRKARQQARRAA